MDTQAGVMAGKTEALHRVKSNVWQNTLLLLMIVWLLLSQSYKGAVNADSPITGWDFRVLYNAADRLNKGEDLYSLSDPAKGTPPYIYTPLVAQVLRPLAHFPLGTALKVCFIGSAACLLAAIFFYAMAVPLGRDEIVPVCVMVLVSFRFWPMVFNFGLGQINNVLLLLACAMFWAERRSKSGLAGSLIAIAALVKLWMFGILIYPLMRRNWKAVTWAIGFYCVALFALFLPLGWDVWQKFIHVTAANAEQRFLVSQSIAGFARLHFASNPHVQALVDSRALYYSFMGGGYLLIGAVFVYLWSRRDPLSQYEARLWFGMAMLSIPLVSPLCHDEYYILALPLLWTLLTVPRVDSTSWRSRFSVAGLILYALFTRPWPTSGDGLARHRDGLGSLLVSSFFLLGAALWVVAVCAILKARRRVVPEAAAKRDHVPLPVPLSIPANS